MWDLYRWDEFDFEFDVEELTDELWKSHKLLRRVQR